ncbi:MULTISPECIES: molybdate ABC transporter permease subunit [unclassified Agarivorans]|uniref:molybdate ABC transporter permease subunit n=1 Tax=unclassified Agarivorans TaxID=2636026 RepID=UPI0026E25EAD|nr:MULTISPECIES: molybdate ABC transporter permease subunit [unclassified Agarivorans]MDO6686023.1 molybdate ABC transporter permease subunit [Agarivorans sp. 3_MG-2023]MDO6713839.1 molybdate ABC transporter permease subunit [Agarivorans sp. 2_MG-2023]
MTDVEIQAIVLSIKLASLSCFILLLVGTPLAWWLARSERKIKHVIEAIVALPIVLPPTVLGFYLLISFAPNSIMGQWWLTLTGSQLAFSFSGLVFASCLYSLPFVVQPIQSAFKQIEPGVLDAAKVLRMPRWKQLLAVELPLAKNGFIVAMVLGFAHTLGEFGVVLMIGGNIPGETQVIAIALFDHVESLNFAAAHRLALVLLGFSFVALLLTYTFSASKKRVGSIGVKF